MADTRDELIEYARRFLGTPYIWGGNNPLSGMDCSGFVCFICRKFGFIGPQEDLTAQGIYDKLKKNGTQFPVASLIYPKGAFVFFGRSNTAITHIGLLVDNGKSMIESGGGNEKTLSLKEAKALGACVRETALRFRSDLVGVILPNYSV